MAGLGAAQRAPKPLPPPNPLRFPQEENTLQCVEQLQAVKKPHSKTLSSLKAKSLVKKMNVAFNVPINQVSFGQVSLLLLRLLHKRIIGGTSDVGMYLFPILN